MRVTIVCEKCHAQVEVHVLGPWDIERVMHTCEHAGSRDRLGRDTFEITYNPPRRVF